MAQKEKLSTAEKHVIFWLVFVYPIGFLLMWLWLMDKWSTQFKLILSIPAIVWILFVTIGNLSVSLSS